MVLAIKAIFLHEIRSLGLSRLSFERFESEFEFSFSEILAYFSIKISANFRQKSFVIRLMIEEKCCECCKRGDVWRLQLRQCEHFVCIACAILHLKVNFYS